jgi:hypothetical protein
MENQITAKLVQQHVGANPLLLDYLQRDLVNVAGLARDLLPIIKKENPKATVESIGIAIHRLNLPKQAMSEQLRKLLTHVQITMRTEVSLLCLKKGSKIPDVSSFSADDVFFVNQGAGEITVIIDQNNESKVKGKPLLHRKNLALVSIKDTLVHQHGNYRVTPGFVAIFLSSISREGINIEDLITTYSQVSFLVDEKDLMKVYQICSKVKNLKHL